MTETITPDTRHLTASMIVLDPSRSKTLLVHHKMMGLWVFPGGHVDPDEAPHECAVREVEEETGLRPRLISPSFLDVRPVVDFGRALPLPIDFAEHEAPEKPERPGKPFEPAHHHLDMLYLGVADPGGKVKAQLDEVYGVLWADQEVLEHMHRQGLTRSDIYPLARLHMNA